MKKNKFILLKKSYPKSKIKRPCDGYEYFCNELNEEERIEYGIELDKVKKYIEIGEKYIYQAAVENGKFKTKYLSLHNFMIIRKKILKDND